MALLCSGLSGTAWGQIALSGGNYQENFDGMGASGTALPSGWAALRLAGTGTVGAALSPVVNEGSAVSGSVYNVGLPNAADRALGSLASASTIPAFGAQFTNATSGDITKFDLTGFMEQWRTGTRADLLESMVFEYSTNATSLNSGTWTALQSLDLVEKLSASTTAEPANGNLDANRTAIAGSFSVRVPSGGTIWFRWKDTDITGNDGMYALDDLVVRPTYSTVDNVPPTFVSASPANGATNVSTQLDLVLTFSEQVEAGPGRVTLSGDDIIISRNANDPEISYSGNTVTIRNLSLWLGVTYVVSVANNAFRDGAGNFFAGIPAGSYSFTTSSTGTPVIFTNQETFTFPLTQTGQYSPIVGYDLSAQHLQGPVTVAVSGAYQISKTNDPASFNGATLTFTATELATTKIVYVRFAPTSSSDRNGTITHTSNGAQAVTVSLSGTAFNPNTQDFNTCSTQLPGGWSQFSVTGAQVWSCTAFGRSGTAVQMSGFSGGNQANEDWLISPAIDLTMGYNYPVLNFWSRTAFSGAPLKLMVSTNYSGTGSPTAAGVTWTEVNGRFPEAASDVWTQTRNLDLTRFKGNNVHVAFVYASTITAAPRWTLDDFEVSNSTTPPLATLITNLTPLSDADFGTLAVGASADKTFTFTTEGLYSDLTVSMAAPFQISKNGTDFAQTLTFTQTEAATANVIVRFTAIQVNNQAYTGRVTFTASNLNQQLGYLTAAVLSKDNTFDVVTWNIEWFGSASQGPSDDALQRANVKKVIEAIDADVYAFQEISNAAAFNELKALLPDYEGFVSTYSNNTQEVAYFYKKATVTEVQRKYLLTGTTNINNFWASGRYPYLLEVDATINGVTKRLHLINIHAKANDGATPEEALVAYNRRLDDVRVLKDSLDRYFPNASIIMLGDYNDDIDETVADVATRVSTYQPFASDAANYRFATLPLSQAGLRTYITRENVIDHILYSNELEGFFIENSARIVIPYAIVGAASPDVYASTTSDHLPVMARFSLVNPLGLRNEAKHGGLQLFPNPTQGAVQLQLPAELAHKNLKLSLRSVQGQVLGTFNGSVRAVSGQVSAKLQGAAAGLYLVVVEVDGKTFYARIVKN